LKGYNSALRSPLNHRIIKCRPNFKDFVFSLDNVRSIDSDLYLIEAMEIAYNSLKCVAM